MSGAGIVPATNCLGRHLSGAPNFQAPDVPAPKVQEPNVLAGKCPWRKKSKRQMSAGKCPSGEWQAPFVSLPCKYPKSTTVLVTYLTCVKG